MANLSDLSGIIEELFVVIGVVITGIVNLLTGDLLILAIVGAFIGLIIGIIVFLLAYIKGIMSNTMNKTKMK